MAEVKTEAGGRGPAVLLALGLREWAARTGYSITLYLLALLAFVISSLSPVWREDYKRDGLIQDTGGPITSVEPASPLGQALPVPCPRGTSHSLARRNSLVAGRPGRGSAAQEGEWQADGPQDTSPMAKLETCSGPQRPGTKDCGARGQDVPLADQPTSGEGALLGLARLSGI